ncbi:hypothetical protein SK128_021473, partial [Halocaridina rubra]
MKNPKYYPAPRDLQVDDIRIELFQQSSNYRAKAKIKGTVRRYSLAPAGSLTSNTEESVEPTHDAPSSDLGLNQILVPCGGGQCPVVAGTTSKNSLN